MSIDIKSKISSRPQSVRRRGATDPLEPNTPAEPVKLPAAPRLAGRRNPRWIALGVIALCLGGLLSYVVYAQVAAEFAVVTMATTVNRGAVIQSTDLTTTTLSGTSKVSVVPADQLQRLVGKRAAYDLVAGSLVPAAAVDEVPLPAAERAVIGVKLNHGRAPVGLLTPSALVRLVALPAGDQSPGPATTTPPQTFSGSVVDTADGADGISLLVNVDVAAADAPMIAQLAAQDRIAILRDADK